MKLIIGLGNPKKEYENTRHNAGFVAIDKFAEKMEAKFTFDKKTNAEVAKTSLKRHKIFLAKPQTFMNNSGIAVRALLGFYKLKSDDMIVVHDDKDIPLGETRVQTDRGPAGHNGVKSIIEYLGTQNFTRIRIGVATAAEIKDAAGFVLGKFTAAEKKILNKVTENVINEIESLV
ncbi:MAG: aminoacyl-tRNA hydrolase [Patescibacteria group bacterium]